MLLQSKIILSKSTYPLREECKNDKYVTDLPNFFAYYIYIFNIPKLNNRQRLLVDIYIYIYNITNLSSFILFEID